MGESWWSKKKRKLQDIKDAKKAKEDRKVAKKMKRKEQVRANKTRKKMGLLRLAVIAHSAINSWKQ